MDAGLWNDYECNLLNDNNLLILDQHRHHGTFHVIWCWDWQLKWVASIWKIRGWALKLASNGKPNNIKFISTHCADKSLEHYTLFKDFSPALLNFASMCIIVFMFFGIPGNLITIFALARCKKVSQCKFPPGRAQQQNILRFAMQLQCSLSIYRARIYYFAVSICRWPPAHFTIGAGSTVSFLECENNFHFMRFSSQQVI